MLSACKAARDFDLDEKEKTSLLTSLVHVVEGSVSSRRRHVAFTLRSRQRSEDLRAFSARRAQVGMGRPLSSSAALLPDGAVVQLDCRLGTPFFVWCGVTRARGQNRRTSGAQRQPGW